MLHGVLLAGWLLSQAAPSPLSPRSLQATQQAYANHVNDCAQHTIVCATDTPIPTATLRPTATPQPAPTSMPAPTDVPELAPGATPEPCWLTDHDLGEPDDGYIVFWLFRDQDGNETYRPLSCDQAWVLTPEPTDVPTPRSTIVPAAPRPPAPPVAPRPVPPRPVPPPTSIPMPTATLVPPDPTTTHTPRPTVVVTSTPTVTPTATSTVTVAPTVTPTPTDVPLAVASLPRLPFDWTGVLVVVSTLFVGSGLTTWLVLRQRRQHLAQLAELGD